MFNEDEYRNNQLNKHLEDDESELSNCCNAEILDNGLCSDCLEPCMSVTEEYENAMCDKADSERELERERDET